MYFGHSVFQYRPTGQRTDSSCRTRQGSSVTAGRPAGEGWSPRQGRSSAVGLFGQTFVHWLSKIFSNVTNVDEVDLTQPCGALERAGPTGDAGHLAEEQGTRRLGGGLGLSLLSSPLSGLLSSLPALRFLPHWVWAEQLLLWKVLWKDRGRVPGAWGLRSPPRARCLVLTPLLAPRRPMN